MSRCAECGSADVSAIVNGTYYCYRCAGALVRRKVISYLNDLKRRGMIPPSVEVPAE